MIRRLAEAEMKRKKRPHLLPFKVHGCNIKLCGWSRVYYRRVDVFAITIILFFFSFFRIIFIFQLICIKFFNVKLPLLLVLNGLQKDLQFSGKLKSPTCIGIVPTYKNV